MTDNKPADSNTNKGVGAFWRGVHDLGRGAEMIVKHPRLWPWAIAPFILNILLYVGVIVGSWLWAVDAIREYLMSGNSWWATAGGWLAIILFWIVMILLLWFTFIPVATLVAAPFNDMLSEKIEAIYTGHSAGEGWDWGLMAKSVWIGVINSLRHALTATGLLILIIPLNLIPVIGSVLYTILSAVITIRYLALEFTSYSMDRRLWRYERRRSFLKTNRAHTLGIGTLSFLIMSIPLVNALMIPIGAAAGTLTFCDLADDLEVDRSPRQGSTS